MRRWTRRSKQMAWSALCGAAAAGILFGFYLWWSDRQLLVLRSSVEAEYKQEFDRLERLAAEQRKQQAAIWVFERPLQAGTRISMADLKRREIAVSAAPAGRVREVDDAIGKVLKIDVSAKTPVLASMLYEEARLADDMRWVETAVIQLPLLLSKRDAIDVRIRFPDGQDYVILSRKAIHELQEPTVWLQMDERERLSFSSACVDAYLHGGQIYALRYIEPHLQKDAAVNYPPNEQVLKLMQSNPNIVKQANAALMSRLRQQMEKEWANKAAERDAPVRARMNPEQGTQAAGYSVPAYAAGASPLTGRAPEAVRDSPFVGPKDGTSAEQFAQDTQRPLPDTVPGGAETEKEPAGPPAEPLLPDEPEDSIPEDASQQRAGGAGEPREDATEHESIFSEPVRR
ncbi:SAF domain-containing protein [Paenibacillus dendritiformis]|uniref:SAF domain-containing protein n=1 Tax=Paenibacillus dendritiformis TaxID=130049 RepID=UPI001F10F802|nr:SAF domain-containing protein [Paenibacillus dendritiformis]